MGVGYYVIHDPLHQVLDDDLRVYRLSGGSYERQASAWFPELRLSLTLWDGEFEAVRHRWLRWEDEHGALIPTGREQRHRVDEEHRRAERAEQLLAEETAARQRESAAREAAEARVAEMERRLRQAGS